MKKLLIVGDANPDLVLRGDVVPRFGQAEQLLDAADLVLGGSAAITACGAARLGIPTRLIAAIGDDLYGRFVADTLAERGVTADLMVVDAGTGLSVVLSAGGGDRAILTLTGAISAVRGSDVNFGDAAHLHVSAYFLQPDLAADLPEVFAKARAAGLTTSLDTNWDPAGRWSGVREVLAYTDVFLPNAAELAAVTGTDDLVAGALDLVGAGTAVVLKDGANGARAWWPGGSGASAGIAVDVIDTTGAGDSFNAGFLSGFLAGDPKPRCLARAVSAGSLSTRAAGGIAAQAHPHEVDALIG